MAMPRLWTLCGVLIPLFAIYLALQSSYAWPYPSWLLATHPTSTGTHIESQSPSTASKLYEEQQKQKPVQLPDGSPSGDQDPGSVDTDVGANAFVSRIVAVGDLHGDIGNAQKVLRMAGVVDDDGNWTGNVDYFVQTGDIIDRGDDTIELYSMMDNLREQALAAGGTMLSLLGNHEWMNVIGDWRYVYPSEIKTFGSVRARAEMITTGRIGKAWATNYTTTCRLPLHPSLGPPNTDYDPESSSPLSRAALSFVHGGLAPQYRNLTPYPSGINNIASSLLAKLRKREFPPPHPPNPYPGLPYDTTREEEELYNGAGPLWYRGWASHPHEGFCDRADEVMEKIGVRRMIMGHTPDFNRIVSRCDGKVIIIDTGISHAYGGVLSALSITYSLAPVPTDEGDDEVWKEKEIVVAIYEDEEEVLAVDERVFSRQSS